MVDCLLSLLMIGVFGNGSSDGEYRGERDGERLLCRACLGETSSRLKSESDERFSNVANNSAHNVLLRVEGAMMFE